MRTVLRLTAAAALFVALLLSGCASVPAPPAAPQPLPESQPPPASPHVQGTAIARAATLMIGAPYHFGGADAAGFDCSGLALYVHETVGLVIPRTALEQQRAAHPVPLTELSPGDLVFFRIRSRHIDHVGIYAGDGRFIHAPHAGVAVSYADLSRGFYAQHLVSAGRFW